MKYPQLVSMPSEISDWLEEQLEARGIDAVVYTRYILSLLHRDSVDVVCPDQDLHFTQPNKEVRRSGSGRKRFRCFSEWRDHAQADTEQLKRSAAIECLMSASDQNCGIESLVDELCEKLKEIKSDPVINSESTPTNNNTEHISPQDLAKQYYAAFPPLNQRCPPATPTNLVNLIPKWFTSPKKKGARRQNRSASFDEKLHHTIEIDSMKSRSNGKQRLGYFSRSRNDLGYSRSMAKSVERSESMTDWDLFMFKNNSKNKLVNNNSDEFGNIAEEKVSSLPQSLELSEKQPKLDDNKNLWNDEESMNICEDLPVDILELLDSPSPQDYTIEMMNLANMRDAGNKNFIQCGTNITSSIWSIDAVVDDTTIENTFNSVLDADQPETLLGIKFKSLTVDNKDIESIWSNPDIVENETNMLFENYRKSCMSDSNNQNCFSNNFLSNNSWDTSVGIEKFEKWSDGDYFDNQSYLRSIAKSLVKLNHNKEESSFIEVIPTSGTNAFNFFNKVSNVVQILSQVKNTDEEKEEENLLTSMRSHFRPINSTHHSNENRNQKQYADGTSFVISGNLDNPNYKRSDSGSEYLVCDNGSPKRLLQYKNKTEASQNSELILKFCVHQNDIACQTDIASQTDITEAKDNEVDNSQEVPCKKRVMSEPEEFFFPGDEEFLDEEPQCTCLKNTSKSAANINFSFGNDTTTCPIHTTRPESVLAEMWKTESRQCVECKTNNGTWNGDWIKSSSESLWELNKESLQNIWNGGQVCSSCLGGNVGRPPLNSQQSQLREDISLDGEQLLSDLSILQKSYMEQLPASEVSYDISELIGGNKERKRRHSPIFEAAKNAVPVHRGSWSIASPMKQDRFLQVTSVPVLHSVTL